MHITNLLDSIEQDLIRIEAIMIAEEKDQFNVWWEQYWWVFNFILFLIIIGFPISIFLTLYMENWIIFGIYMIWFTTFIFSIFFIRAQAYNKLWEETRNNILNHLKIHKKLINTIDITDAIDDIMENMKTMQVLIWESISLTRKSTLSIFRDLAKKELLFCTGILEDLRSDLSIRLTEQQQSLESAKSEVEKNIQWTTELESVSELQRARLDRQIEQFEELQKVLVKV